MTFPSKPLFHTSRPYSTKQARTGGELLHLPPPTYDLVKTPAHLRDWLRERIAEKAAKKGVPDGATP